MLPQKSTSSSILTDIHELLNSQPIKLSGSVNNNVSLPSLPSTIRNGTVISSLVSNPSFSLTSISVPVQQQQNTTVGAVKEGVELTPPNLLSLHNTHDSSNEGRRTNLIDRIIKDSTLGITVPVSNSKAFISTTRTTDDDGIRNFSTSSAAVASTTSIKTMMNNYTKRNNDEYYTSSIGSTLPPVSFVSPTATLASNNSLMNITDVEDNSSTTDSDVPTASSNKNSDTDTLPFHLTNSPALPIVRRSTTTILTSPLELEAEELLRNEEYIRQQQLNYTAVTNHSRNGNGKEDTSVLSHLLPSSVLSSIHNDPLLGFLRTSLTIKPANDTPSYIGDETSASNTTMPTRPLSERARILLQKDMDNIPMDIHLTKKEVRKINDWERKGTQEVINDWNHHLRGYQRLPQPQPSMHVAKPSNKSQRPVRLAYSVVPQRSKSVPSTKNQHPTSSSSTTVPLSSSLSIPSDPQNRDQQQPPSQENHDNKENIEQPLPSSSSLSLPWTGTEVAELRHRLRLLKSRFVKRTVSGLSTNNSKVSGNDPFLDRLPSRPSVHQLFPKDYLKARRTRSQEPVRTTDQDIFNSTARTSIIASGTVERIPHPPMDTSLLPKLDTEIKGKNTHYLLPELRSSFHQQMINVYAQQPSVSIPTIDSKPLSSAVVTDNSVISSTTSPPMVRTVPSSPPMTYHQAKDMFVLSKLSLSFLCDNHTRQRWNQECTPQTLYTLLSSDSIADTLDENNIPLPSMEHLLRWFHLSEPAYLPAVALAVITLRKVSEELETMHSQSLQAIRVLYHTKRQRIIRTRIESLIERRQQIIQEISVQETLSRTGLSNLYNPLTLLAASPVTSPNHAHSKDDNDKDHDIYSHKSVIIKNRRNSYSTVGTAKKLPTVLYQAAERGEGSPYRLALLYDLLAQITAKIPFEIMKTQLLLRKTLDQYLHERDTLLGYHRTRIFLARMKVRQCIARIRLSVARTNYVLKRRNFLRHVHHDWLVSAVHRSGERGREVIAGQLAPLRLREKYFRYLRSHARAMKASKTYTDAVSVWKQSYRIAEVFQGWKLYVKRVRAIHGRMDSLLLRTGLTNGTSTEHISGGIPNTEGISIETVPYGLRASPTLIANLHTLRRDSIKNEIRSVTETLTQNLYSSSASSSFSTVPTYDTSPRIAILARQYALQTRVRMHLRKSVLQYIRTARCLLSLAVSDLLMSYQINGGWTWVLYKCLDSCIQRGIPKISVAPIYSQLPVSYRSQRMVEAIGPPLRNLGYQIYTRQNMVSSEPIEPIVERIDPLAVGLALQRSQLYTPTGHLLNEEDDDSFHSTPSRYALQLWSRIPWSLLGVSIDSTDEEKENEHTNTVLRTTQYSLPSSSHISPVVNFMYHSRYVEDTLSATNYPGHTWTKYLASSIATAPTITAEIDNFHPLVDRPIASPLSAHYRSVPPSLLNSRAPTPMVPPSTDEPPVVPIVPEIHAVVPPTVESRTVTLPPLPFSRPSSRLSVPNVPLSSSSSSSSRRNSLQSYRPSSRLSNRSTTSSLTPYNPVSAAAYTDLLQRATLIANRKLVKRMFAVWIHRSRLWNLKKRIIALWRYRRQREAMDAWKGYVYHRKTMYSRCTEIGNRLRQRQAFLTWESNIRNRLRYYDTQIVKFRYDTLTRKVVTALRTNVRTNQMVREQEAKADRFYRQWVQRKWYVRWKLLSLAHKPYRLFTKYIQHRQSVRAARPLWLKWRVFTENRQLLRRVFLIGIETRRLQLENEAVRHERNFQVLCDVLSAWKGYAKQEKEQRHELALQYTAEASHRHRTLYRTFQQWKLFHTQEQKVRQFRRLIMQRRKVYYLRFWAQLHMRRQACLLRLYWRWNVQQPLLRTVRFWQKVTRIEGMRNQELTRRVFEQWKQTLVLVHHPLITTINDRYIQARRKRTFRAWKQFTVRSVYVKDVASYCKEERKRRQVRQALNRWLVNAKQQRANRLFITPPLIVNSVNNGTAELTTTVVTEHNNSSTPSSHFHRPSSTSTVPLIPSENESIHDSLDITQDLVEPPVPVLLTASLVMPNVPGVPTIVHESTQTSLPSVTSPGHESTENKTTEETGTNTTRIMTVMVQTDNLSDDSSLLFRVDAGTSMSQDHSTLSSISTDSLDRIDFLTPSLYPKQKEKTKDYSVRKSMSLFQPSSTVSSSKDKALITVRDNTLETAIVPDQLDDSHSSTSTCPIFLEQPSVPTVVNESSLTALSTSTNLSQQPSRSVLHDDSLSGILNSSAALLSRPGTAVEERMLRDATPIAHDDDDNILRRNENTESQTPVMVQRPASALTTVNDESNSILHPDETSSPSHGYHHPFVNSNVSPGSISSPLSIAVMETSIDSIVSVDQRRDDYSAHTPFSNPDTSRTPTIIRSTSVVPNQQQEEIIGNRNPEPLSSLPSTISPPKLTDKLSSSSSVVIVTIGSPVDSLYQSSIDSSTDVSIQRSMYEETGQQTSPVPVLVPVQYTDMATSPIVVPRESPETVPTNDDHAISTYEEAEMEMDEDEESMGTVDDYVVNAPVIVINVGNSPSDSLQNYSATINTENIKPNVSMGIQTSPLSRLQYSPELLVQHPSNDQTMDDSLTSHATSSTIRNFSMSPSSPVVSLASSVSANAGGQEFMIVTIGSPTDSLQNLSSSSSTNVMYLKEGPRTLPVQVSLPTLTPPPPLSVPVTPIALPLPVAEKKEEPRKEEIRQRRETSMQTSPIPTSTPPKEILSIPFLNTNAVNTMPEEEKIEEHFIYIPIGSPSDSLADSVLTNTTVSSDKIHMRSFEQEMKDELSIDMDRSKPSIHPSPLSSTASLSSSILSFAHGTTKVSVHSPSSSSLSSNSLSIENQSTDITNVMVVTVGSPTDSLKEGKNMVTMEVQTSPFDTQENSTLSSQTDSLLDYDNTTESSISIDQPYQYLTIGSPTDSLRHMDKSSPIHFPTPVPVLPKYSDATIQTSPPSANNEESSKSLPPKIVKDKSPTLPVERPSVTTPKPAPPSKKNDTEFTVVVVGTPTDSLNNSSFDNLYEQKLPIPSPITPPAGVGPNDNMYVAIGETDSLNGDRYRRTPLTTNPLPSQYYAGEIDSIDGDGNRRLMDDASQGSSRYSVDPLLYIQSFNDNDSLDSRDRSVISHTGHSPIPNDSIDNIPHPTIVTTVAPPVVPLIRKTTVIMVNRANQDSKKAIAASTTTTTIKNNGTKDVVVNEKPKDTKTNSKPGTPSVETVKSPTTMKPVATKKETKKESTIAKPVTKLSAPPPKVGTVNRPVVPSSTSAVDNSLLLTSTFVTSTTTTTMDETVPPSTTDTNILPLTNTILMDITEETKENEELLQEEKIPLDENEEHSEHEEEEEEEEGEKEEEPVRRAHQNHSLRVRSRSRNRGRKFPPPKIVPQLRTVSPPSSSEPVINETMNIPTVDILSSTTNEVVELLNLTSLPSTNVPLTMNPTNESIESQMFPQSRTVNPSLSTLPVSTNGTKSVWKPKPIPTSLPIVDKSANKPPSSSLSSRPRYTKTSTTNENTYEWSSMSKENIFIPQIDGQPNRSQSLSAVSPRSINIPTGISNVVTDERIPLIKSSSLPESYLAPPLSLSLPNPIPLPADFDITNYSIPEGYTAMFVTASQLPLPIAVAKDIDPAEPVAILVPNSNIDTVIESEEHTSTWKNLQRTTDKLSQNISETSKQLIREIKELTRKE